MYKIGKEEVAAVSQVIESGQLFRYRGGEGGWCDRFEKALAQKIGVKHALTVSSGTAALMCACEHPTKVLQHGEWDITCAVCKEWLYRL